jgi:hypothetical protein
MKRSEQVRIIGNLVRRCEQLECIAENCAYLLANKNHVKIGRSKNEIKIDLRRAYESYPAALQLLMSYCKKVGEAENLIKNQQEENSKSKMSGGLFPGVLPTERREKAV